MIYVLADQKRNTSIVMDDWNNDRIAVAVGVVIKQEGKILIAKRQSHQHQGDCWEFPGGKVEPNESIYQAIKRELNEEVGIDVLQSEPWLEIQHDYHDKAVCLIVHKITSFSGMALGKEGQQIRWIFPQELQKYRWPDANSEIVKALAEQK